MSSNKERIRKKIESYRTQITKLKEARSRLLNEIKGLKKEKRRILDDKRRMLEEKDKRINDLESKLRKAGELEDITEEKRELIDELEDENIQLRKELEELNEENERLMEDSSKSSIETGDYGVKSTQELTLHSNSEVHGDILCEDTLTVEDGVIIKGSIEADGDINLGNETEVEGDVISINGYVFVGRSSKIEGMIKGKEISLDKETSAGDLESDSNVTIEEETSVGDISALGDVELKDNVKVDGSVEYAGSLQAGNRVTITDSVLPRTREEIEGEVEEELEESEEEELEESEKEVEDEGEGKETEEENEEEVIVCPVCGSEVNKDFNFCDSCGADLKSKK